MPIYLVASTTELIDGGLEVGEKFGFAGIVALVMMGGMAYVGYRLLDVWTKNQELRTTSELAQSERLIAAQTASYERHIQFTDTTQQAVSRMAETTLQIGQAITSLASLTETSRAQFDQLTRKTDATLQLAVDVIHTVLASDLVDEHGRKLLQGALRKQKPDGEDLI
jgi:hypothetical protein